MSELSENEKLLISKICSNDLEEVKQILNESDVRINCMDENGMTGLEHSAYKGNYEMTKYLLERGAEPNHNKHIHGYTALMFAALGGYNSVVNLLLESGADVSAVNSVGRNASQMSAFVGQHSTVAIINNFISRDHIQYYTKIHGLEKEPLISGRLVSPLHSLVKQTNVHPIRIGLFLKNNWILIENSNKVIKVLELLCEKQFKTNENEMISFKCHHLAFVLNHFIKDLPNIDDKEKRSKEVDSLLKNWLKSRKSDGFPLYLEQFLRESIRGFPYRESALFQQLVRTLSTVEIGSEPSAISILSQAINGQKGFDEDSQVCESCGEPKPTKRCAKCKQTYYCNTECQALHWPSHKKCCHPEEQ